MKCKKCGSEIEDSVEFCPYCGDKVEKAVEVSDSSTTEEKPAGQVKCGYCGSLIFADSNNCPYCGMKVDHHADDITTVIPNASNKGANVGRFASYHRGSDSVNAIIFAAVSMVLSVVSFFILGFLSFFGVGLSISGLVFALRGRKSGDNSIIGLILSLVALVLSIVMVILYIIALIVSFSGQA